MTVFAGFYSGKKVLVTGHTGFKGSWLSTWLLDLGASVVGLSKDVPTTPAMFDANGLRDRVAHHVADIRDLAHVQNLVLAERPDIVFHLAAQAIVSQSYSDPIETIATNAIGTANILEALRRGQHPCVAVLITSDKCYDNAEWVWGYRETDTLGGKDVYSGSKAAAEMIIRSFAASFFSGPRRDIRVGIGRAGNVIGGGDWGRDRIVADCVRAWSQGVPVELRRPNATRPWQHVLEPLSGYLTLGATLAANADMHGEAYNFGPRADQDRTVLDLARGIAATWHGLDADQAIRLTDKDWFHEAGLLKLNCDKALAQLKWEPTLFHDETVRFTGDWYYRYHQRGTDMHGHTLAQIREYETLGLQRGRAWAAP